MIKTHLGVGLVFTSLFFSNILFAQTPSIKWQRFIGGTQTEQIKKIEQIPSKGYLLFGSTNSCDGIVQNFHGQEDVFVMLIDFNGNIKWIKTFGGSSQENPIDFIYNPYSERIEIIMSSSSKDGDFTFNKNNVQGSFYLSLDTEGKLTDNISSYQFTDDVFQPTLGKKFTMSGKSTYLLRTDSYFGIKKDEFRTILSVIYYRVPDEYKNDKNFCTSPEFSCYPASMNDDDIFSIADLVDAKDKFGQTTGFVTIGQTNTSKIVTMEYNNITKGKKNITLKNFHSDIQNKSDAFILMMKRKDRLANLEAGLGLSIGGKGTEIAHQIFNTGFDTYRCLITSDSYDGDFKANKGKGDVWAVDFNKTLKVNRILNLGTVHDDQFVSAINFEKSTAVLLYAGNINVSTTLQNSDLPLVNSENNANGLRLIQFNDKELISEVNFNLHDLNARVFRTIEQKLIVTSLIPNGKTNALGIVCLEMGTGKVLWQKTISDYDFVSADLASEIFENSFYLIGTARNIKQSGSEPDIFMMNLSSLPNINSGKISFNDNLSDNIFSDTLITNQVSLMKMQVSSLISFNKDTSNIGALWQFAQISEYLADYDLAVKAYSTIITKLNKVKDKSQISKATAHQITCKFLLQSEKTERKDSIKAESENSDGFYGIGINYLIVNNQLMVSNVTAGKGADLAGVKPCDEIVNINGIDVLDDCITTAIVSEKLKGEKGTSVNLSVKRFGEKKLLSFTVKRSFIANTRKVSQQKNNTSTPQPIASTASTINQKQKQKQNFLQKVVTALQKDTSLMKQIETAKKINYALTIINKWSNEPVDKKFLLQIDEQLGMVSSLINLAKGKSININTDGTGKISFGDPALKQIANYDYAKEAESKFDSIAKAQPYTETKIDKNISFVEKNSMSKSGYYQCLDMSYDNLTSEIKTRQCSSSDNWKTYSEQTPSYAGMDGYLVQHEYKNSLIKIILTSSSILISGTQESKTLPHSFRTGMAGYQCEQYNGGSYQRISFEGKGTNDSKSNQIMMEYTNVIYYKNGGSSSKYIGSSGGMASKLAMDFCKNFNMTATENTSSSNTSVSQTIEYLPNNEIKLTSNKGWIIYKKIKDL